MSISEFRFENIFHGSIVNASFNFEMNVQFQIIGSLLEVRCADQTAQLLVCIVSVGPKVEKSPFVSLYIAKISQDNINNWANLIFIFPQLTIANLRNPLLK
jgi:hypothetical protein